MAVLVLAVAATTTAERATAALNHKSFEKCWSKSVKETGVDENIMLPIKKTTEQQAMSGNTTTDGKKPSATDPANGFTEGIRDCMLQVDLSSGSNLQALFKK